MLRRASSTRRLLRKRMYRAPHTRAKQTQFVRMNKNLVKPHQEHFKDLNGPNIKKKRRPKREVQKGFKMSYRYKYYKPGAVVEEENIEENIEENEEESE